MRLYEYMMMRFIITYENVVFNGQAQYLKDESSFFYDPWNAVNFSILIEQGYNSLDINLETGRVLQVTGINPNYNWIEKELVTPVFKRGILTVSFDEKRQEGTGIQYANDWQTYFNYKTGWVCIGNPDCNSESKSVEFAQNSVAVIDDGQLSSIWIRPQFV